MLIIGIDEQLALSCTSNKSIQPFPVGHPQINAPELVLLYTAALVHFVGYEMNIKCTDTALLALEYPVGHHRRAQKTAGVGLHLAHLQLHLHLQDLVPRPAYFYHQPCSYHLLCFAAARTLPPHVCVTWNHQKCTDRVLGQEAGAALHLARQKICTLSI